MIYRVYENNFSSGYSGAKFWTYRGAKKYAHSCGAMQVIIKNRLTKRRTTIKDLFKDKEVVSFPDGHIELWDKQKGD